MKLNGPLVLCLIVIVVAFPLPLVEVRKHIDIHRYIQNGLNRFNGVVQLERDKLDTFRGKNVNNLA
jgi:hypothetical protein